MAGYRKCHSASFDAFGLRRASASRLVDLFVGRDDVAQIAAEQILVEMLDLAGAVTSGPTDGRNPG